jgi:hypothetical protein
MLSTLAVPVTASLTGASVGGIGVAVGSGSEPPQPAVTNMSNKRVKITGFIFISSLLFSSLHEVTVKL